MEGVNDPEGSDVLFDTEQIEKKSDTDAKTFLELLADREIDHAKEIMTLIPFSANTSWPGWLQRVLQYRIPRVRLPGLRSVCSHALALAFGFVLCKSLVGGTCNGKDWQPGAHPFDIAAVCHPADDESFSIETCVVTWESDESVGLCFWTLGDGPRGIDL